MMKSYRLIFLAIFLITAAWGVKVYAGQINMTTFYPAPNGYYDTLTVRTRLNIPCYTSAPTSPRGGNFYAVNNDPLPCDNPIAPPF